LAKILQIKSYQADMEGKQRTLDQENALSRVYQSAIGADGKVDRNALYTGVAREGLGSKIPGLQEQFLKTDKAGAEAEKLKLANNMQKLTLGAQILSTARDQATYDRARAEAQAQGLDVSRMPPQFDPAFVQTKLQESQSIADQLAQVWKQKGYDLDVRKQGESERHNRSTEGISAGQLQVARGNLGVAQQNLGLRGQELEYNRTQGKAPAGYRFKGDGSLEAIPGGPASSKTENATEGERKAATLLQRLEGSQRQLDTALAAAPGAAKPELLSSAVRGAKLLPGSEPLANTLTSEKRQQVEAAQLDMLDAALTLGTGAAYTKEQLEGYRKSYFPQIGDDKATVADKKARLQNVIQAAKIAAGRAAPKGGSAAPSAPNIDSLLDKYK
jgi:hypothetical protein